MTSSVGIVTKLKKNVPILVVVIILKFLKMINFI